MSAELQIDDLDIGMYITVLVGKFHGEQQDAHPITGVVCVKAAFEDNSFKGDVLKITAMDLPFIVVKCCNKPHSYGSGIVLDLRQGWKFKKLSKEYVDAACKS